MASECLVMNFEMKHGATILTPPVVPLQNLLS
jgi:hypothetical protein